MACRESGGSGADSLFVKPLATTLSGFGKLKLKLDEPQKQQKLQK